MNKNKGGAPFKYTPKELDAKIKEYFKYIDSSPIEKRKVEIHKGETKEYIDYIKRPYTIEGLCDYLDISTKTFHNWENNDGLLQIVMRARQTIRSNKLEGATAGLFNANIVIRDLSLRDTDTPQVINNLLPIGRKEARLILGSLADEYGELPETQPKTIDISNEEV